MRVERRERALGVGGVVGHHRLGAVGPSSGAPLTFVAADDALLLAERRAVPALDEVADDPDRLVAAAARPRRARRRPAATQTTRVHQRGVGAVGVGRAVAEAEEVARALRRGSGPARRCTGTLPACAHLQHQLVGHRSSRCRAARGPRCPGVLAQNWMHEVAVAEVGGERVVAETWSSAAARAASAAASHGRSSKSEAPSADGDRQRVGRDHRAEDAAVRRRQPRVELGHRPAVGEEDDALGQPAEQPLERRPGRRR